MATRKGGKGKGGKRSGKSKFFRFLLVLGLLVATLLAAFVLLILRPYENQPSAPAESAKIKAPARPAQQAGGSPERAVPPTFGRPGTAAQPVGPEAGDRELPLLAIIIDDMGNQQQLDAELLHLNLNLTFAFLPQSPHTPEQAELAGRLGREVLLHLPMEPRDQRWDPGPGALTLAMTPSERAAVFAQGLALVPQAVGVNNHMGSRFTEDQAAMQDFLGLVRDRRLFFVDSLTSPASLGYTLAREMGVKTSRRQVFLDNVREPDRIRAQIRELLTIAERQGWAVGIGHPYPQTLAALREAQPEILSRAKLVGVSRLAN